MPHPPRRRPTPSAAKLPPSRLPLGTHLPGTDLPSTSADQTRTSSSPLPESDTATHVDIKHHPSFKTTPLSSDMSESDMSDISQPAHSLAEAKLRRQQERIQIADAALAAPLTSRRRDNSPGKLKTNWKPLDVEWDTIDRDKSDTTVPVHTRTNTIYGPAFSRETSLTRSLSSASNQTPATDAERHDSVVDNAGFQTYYGRRGRKHPDELNATEIKKQDERQATVEGTYDKREIRNVFGRELPGLDFISSNPGFRDAQLQFVQHPNGDVSAHMWSQTRFMWENIGNFSNIRKRVEGQLASDRLKGETAWQTLQKHSLAYFRAIAKQREQIAMGETFGQAEIQQILPQPPKSTQASKPSRAASPASTTPSRQMSTAPPPLFNAVQQSTVATCTGQGIAQPKPQVQHPVSTSQFPFLPSKNDSEKQAALPGHGIFLQTTRPTLTANASPRSTAQPLPSHPLNAVYQKTSTAPVNHASRLNFPATQPTPHVEDAKTSTSPAFAPAAASSLTATFLRDMAKLRGVSMSTTQASAQHRSLASSVSSSPSKPPTPMTSREAMRDQLLKVSAFAQQRSNSREQIRTVLHDPFQSEYPKRAMNVAGMHKEDDISQNVTRFAKPQGFLLPEESLADSVPDTDSYGHSSSRVSSLQSSSTAYVAEEASNDASVGRKNYDEELSEWWNSGNNRFARQEDLYQRIMALELRNPSHRSTALSYGLSPSARAPGAHLTSANKVTRNTTTSAAENASTSVNKTFTRALIPVYENLASYVQGPIEKRRDYWSNWSQPPEWCIDRSANGNNSFFDEGWGTPPARVGRDPRYRPVGPGELRFGGFGPGTLGGSPRGNRFPGIPGMKGGLGFGPSGRYG